MTIMTEADLLSEAARLAKIAGGECEVSLSTSSRPYNRGLRLVSVYVRPENETGHSYEARTWPEAIALAEEGIKAAQEIAFRRTVRHMARAMLERGTDETALLQAGFSPAQIAEHSSAARHRADSLTTAWKMNVEAEA